MPQNEQLFEPNSQTIDLIHKILLSFTLQFCIVNRDNQFLIIEK